MWHLGSFLFAFLEWKNGNEDKVLAKWWTKQRRDYNYRLQSSVQDVYVCCFFHDSLRSRDYSATWLEICRPSSVPGAGRMSPGSENSRTCAYTLESLRCLKSCFFYYSVIFLILPSGFSFNSYTWIYFLNYIHWPKQNLAINIFLVI